MTELIKIDKAMVESFEINLLDVQKMVDEYQKLKLMPEDKESYKVCRTALTKCVRNRTSIDKRRKELNTEDQDRIKKRNGVAKELTELISPAEKHLEVLVKGEDDRVAKIKAEKAQREQERVDTIQEKIAGITSLTASLHLQPDSTELNNLLVVLDQKEITPELFQEFTPQANDSKHETRLTLLKALDARKEFEAKEQALWVQEKESEKQKAELEKQKKAQDEAQAKIDAEKKKLEQEKFEAEAVKKAQDTVEGMAKEQGTREVEVPAEPDKAVLVYWLKHIEAALDSHHPVLETEEAKAVFRVSYERIEGAVKYAWNIIGTL